MKHILIIEDNIAELGIAKQIANERGLETRVAQDFSTALSQLTQYPPGAIASDLFFPAGNIPQEQYIQKILPIYQDYLKNFKPKIDGPLVEVLKNLFGENKDKTKEELWYGFILPVFLKSWGEHSIELVKDAHFGIESYSRHEKLLKQIEEVKLGRNIPYGIFITEEASKLKIPLYTVTSTNHHDIAFEPIRTRIGNYTDNLIDGHKDWARAFNSLTEKMKGGVK